ncbi:AGAP003156-PA-like protein [Anopheles sinensis]|uniref:isoleucine--tRNA ligase n=1 Tax=Anopheles sinensis TaxID=74873 RepID=A0A084WA17_ANOSI|nr:AGAP003156-PA-like protein [Anopheles sinensis]
MLQSKHGWVIGTRFTVRCFATKSVPKDESSYTGTINLPKTKFPARLNVEKRNQIEEQLRKNCFSQLYAWNRSNLPEKNEFILHDGPPYANGDLHMGHAVNKILKDLILKHKIISGTRVHYVPGWDCHGLPIELKALEAFNKKKKHGSTEARTTAVDIRNTARKFALETITKQKNEFESWGITGSWNDTANGYYRTLDPGYIRAQLRLFYELYERKLVYRDLKPVYWSPSSQSALAEAELEYDEAHRSPSLYLKFQLANCGTGCEAIEQLQRQGTDVHAAIWTTTPWTLPANQAICYNPSLEYCLVRASNGDILLIGKELVGYLSQELTLPFDVLQSITAAQLRGLKYHHPLNRAELLPFLPGAHVKAEKGTGLVHTAPAHGPEDFLVCLEQQIPVKNLIDDKGCYNKRASSFLVGKYALTEGNLLITDEVQHATLKLSTIEHSYPIDWRTKQPVMLRASDQWFIDTNSLKQLSLEAVKEVNIFPRTSAEVSKKVLEGQLRKRPYWCISRQRAWGVPIPVLYNTTSKQPIAHPLLLKAIEERLMKESSIDFWWTVPVEKLVPKEMLQQLNTSHDQLEKGHDILDIWFDSGTSWLTVLGKERVADLYLEGVDQFTGWFQSSLLTSIAARDRAPYKAIFVHGFAVDENGLKMSKSLGNVISPKSIVDRYGCDTLRWWVCAHAIQNTSIPVSHKLLASSAEGVQKLRGIFKFLLGVLNANGTLREKEPVIREDLLCHVDRYFLRQLTEFHRSIFQLYETYQHNRASAAILNFCLSTLSGLYLHVVKDRLYCGTRAEHENVVAILTQTYRVLSKTLWPIIPFLVEESWTFYGKDSFFQSSQPPTPSEPLEPCNSTKVIESALELRHSAYQQAQLNVNTWLLELVVECSAADLSFLSQLHPKLNVPESSSELCELLQVGSIHLREGATDASGRFAITVTKSEKPLCRRCRRYSLVTENPTSSDVCPRCEIVLNQRGR